MATSFPLVVAASGLALAAVHAAAGRLRFRTIPRSYWLSGAGGVSVAYVFIHILPELDAGQAAIEASVLGFLEHHVYLLALSGFALYYGVERLAQRSTDDGEGGERPDLEESDGVFWVHVGSFAAYNLIIGYLLVHRERPGLDSLLFYAFAVGLHFLVNDHGLREHHHDAYDRVGRWVLAAAVLTGVGVGLLTSVGEPLVMSLFAFLAGGIILNVIKEELPKERRSNFWAFGVGTAGYAALLLLV
ncbi:MULTISPECIES: hypothetical protein [Halorussus]|uniref:hypothetical protein n=1 Tax=Halorussus TaxID=1070314 RepID=UPI0020A2141D|nr:hypothetical protein [Halorussus vallis]USZ75883.1 hypothetical protein NGM07_00840 [Halorussus vallis]